MPALPEVLSPLLSVLDDPHAPVVDHTVAHANLAAVVVLLYPGRLGPSFLLTMRPHTLNRHPGQISLPGGRVEPDDASPWMAALRETREEVGMRTGRLHLLGRLTPIHVQASNHVVVPFVAWNPFRPRLLPHPAEVAELIEVPVSMLVDPASLNQETWELRGERWIVGFYRFHDSAVWGATARILGDLANRLTNTTTLTVPGSVVPA